MNSVTKQQVKSAKTLDLLTYMKNHVPHNLVRKGHEYCTKDHDSLVISENGLWHWFSRGIGGKTALQYLIKVKNMSFVDAVNRINNLQTTKESDINYVEKSIKPFVLPKAHTDNNRVFIYLKCRGISKDVINYCVHNKLIYESTDYHNAVFVGYDGETPKYAALRGTYQQANNQFKGEVKGSDKRFSFSVTPHSKSNKLKIAESAIDVLSVATLRDNIGEVHYLSIGGAYAPKSSIEKAKMPKALEQYLSDHKDIEEIELCLDNDRTGIGASFFLMQRLMGRGYEVVCSILNTCKDWNESLAHLKKTSRSNNIKYCI